MSRKEIGSNVTRFPARGDAPREICHFGDGYLENLYYSDGWKRLAHILSTWRSNISPNMHEFIRQMQARKTRPTINQLSLMVGLLVGALARDHFNKWEDAEEKANSAEIVPIGRK